MAAGLREGAGGRGAVFASGTVPASAAAAASAVIAVDRRGSAFDRGERDSGGGEGEGHETVGSKATALLVLSALCDGHRAAQAACFEAGLLPHCAHAMHDDEPVMQCWAALCLAKLVQTNASIATAALALPGFASRQATLIGHRVVEVRAAAVHLQGKTCARSRRRRRRLRAPAAAPSAAAGAPASAVEAAAAIDSLAVRRLRSVLAPRCSATPHLWYARSPRHNLVAAPRTFALAATRLDSAPPTPAARAAVDRQHAARLAARAVSIVTPTHRSGGGGGGGCAPWAPAPWARRWQSVDSSRGGDSSDERGGGGSGGLGPLTTPMVRGWFERSSSPPAARRPTTRRRRPEQSIVLARRRSQLCTRCGMTRTRRCAAWPTS